MQSPRIVTVRKLNRHRVRCAVAVALAAWTSACAASGPVEPKWPPAGKKWFERAQESFRTGDIEDADLAIENALRVVPNRAQVRVLAARIALSQLEYDEVLSQLRAVRGSDARALRARAFWYSGQIDKAADELEALNVDPEVRDPWAREVAKLARRGVGRKPFEMSGGLLAVSTMPVVGNPAMLVPLEVNGDPALAMIDTSEPEAVIDAGTSGEPSWVSLRFGERVEVRDVPAVARDLSGVSQQVNAPVKLLIGVNLLRRLHATFDYAGSQFVVRSFEPPPPPYATTIDLNYLRGGNMLMRGAFGTGETAPRASLLIDTRMTYPAALDEQGFVKAGLSLSELKPVANAPDLKYGIVPMVRMGAFEVPQVPAIHGAPVSELEQLLDVDLDGMVGAGLLAAFRVTFVDGGRRMWLEPMPQGATQGSVGPAGTVAAPPQPMPGQRAPAGPPPKGSEEETQDNAGEGGPFRLDNPLQRSPKRPQPRLKQP